MDDIDNTNINLVWAVTEILSPVREPVNNVPTARTPVNDGDKARLVPACLSLE